MSSIGPCLVKFGGSLLGSPERRALLAAAAQAGAVVVPGGGPFADMVRTEQARLGFSDAAAHAMAILAMDQTARLLADAEPRFSLCGDVNAIEAAVADARPAMWAPSAMALAADDLPASWDVTADSLAIWLAIRLRASRLVLLKSAPCPAGAGLARLAADGVVDAHAPTLAARFAGEIVSLGPAKAETLGAALSAPLRRAA